MAVTDKPVQVRPNSVRIRTVLRDLLLSQEVILLLILILVVLFLSTRNERFLQSDNILNQGRLLTEVALVALPMTFIIITGGIDLSVGSTFGLSAVMLWFAWQRLNLPLELAIPIALLTGIVCGFVNGWFIVRLSVPPLI